MKNILITGGGGYIGSHTCKYLHRKGYSPIVIDNLSQGHRKAVKWGSLFEGSLSERKFLLKVFSKYNFMAVMHFAASCYVGESVQHPDRYYRNNVVNTLNLLDVMVQKNVLQLVFSSSCATYGVPLRLPITEKTVQSPINPYGKSKLMVEDILKDYQQSYGLNYATLRYFNAAGADPEGELGECHRPETHLIPILLSSVLDPSKPTFTVYGADYSTTDGTCIRDYIHVEDIARAHFLALESLLGGSPSIAYNLGNGVGYSVKEVIHAVEYVTGKKVKYQFSERRTGDPPTLISNSSKIYRALSWKPYFQNLHDIISTAWNWHKRNPNGY